MASGKTLFRNIERISGLDLRATPPAQTSINSSRLINAQFAGNTIVKRKGGLYHPSVVAGYTVLGAFKRSSFSSTGAVSEELVYVIHNPTSGALYVVPYDIAGSEALITITSTAAYNATITIGLDGSTSSGRQNYRMTFTRDDTGASVGAAFPKSLGRLDGIVTCSSVQSDIDALADFACTTTATTERAVALLAGTYSITAGGSLSIYGQDGVGHIAGSDLANNEVRFISGSVYPSSSDYDHISALSLNSVLYIAPNNYLIKYDGARSYRAGAPKPSDLTLAAGAAGNPNGTYISKHTYITIDAEANRVESVPSDEVSVTVANQIITTTVTSLRNTDYNMETTSTTLRVNGAHGAGPYTQINVRLNAATQITSAYVKVGDRLCFNDATTGTVVDALVTAIDYSGGTGGLGLITIDTAVTTLTSGDPISRGIKIAVYRTKDSGGIFYLSKEMVNDSTASITYSDNVADASLVEEFLEPAVEHGLPPKCKYLAEHQGLLVAAGDPANPNTVFWSDVESPEYFPEGIFQVDVPTTKEGGVTGVISGGVNTLCIFKKNSYFPLVGSLFNEAVEYGSILDGGQGCVSHQSLAVIGDGLILGLGNDGFFAVENGVISNAIGIPLEIVTRGQYTAQVDGTAVTSANAKAYNRAVGFNDYRNKLYMCAIPTESGTGGTTNAASKQNSTSTTLDSDGNLELHDSGNIFVLDYRDINNLRWSVWQMPAFMFPFGRMCIFKNRLTWCGRSFIAPTTHNGFVFTESDLGTTLDYNDSSYPVSVTLTTNADNMGVPDMYKSLQRVKIFNPSERSFPYTQLFGGIDYPFDIDFGIYLNNSTSKDTSGTVTFSAATDLHRVFRARRGKKASFFRFEFTNRNFSEGFAMAGWSFESSINKKESIKD